MAPGGAAISLRSARGEADTAVARELFQQYAASLGFDLSFQNFAAELRDLPGDYQPPDGDIMLAHLHGQAAGCVALRRLDHQICEMKRLFAQPAYRGQGLGQALLSAVIQRARELGYRSIRLDTVPTMQSAQRLYDQAGFNDIAPYCHNPIQGTRFMELIL